jgi:hypothetical protein
MYLYAKTILRKSINTLLLSSIQIYQKKILLMNGWHCSMMLCYYNWNIIKIMYLLI